MISRKASNTNFVFPGDAPKEIKNKGPINPLDISITVNILYLC